jgi:hypothetical protein
LGDDDAVEAIRKELQHTKDQYKQRVEDQVDHKEELEKYAEELEEYGHGQLQSLQRSKTSFRIGCFLKGLVETPRRMFRQDRIATISIEIYHVFQEYQMFHHQRILMMAFYILCIDLVFFLQKSTTTTTKSVRQLILVEG